MFRRVKKIVKMAGNLTFISYLPGPPSERTATLYRSAEKSNGRLLIVLCHMNANFVVFCRILLNHAKSCQISQTVAVHSGKSRPILKVLQFYITWVCSTFCCKLLFPVYKVNCPLFILTFDL